MSLFKLRGELSKSQSLILGILGFVILIGLWWALAEAMSINRPITNNNYSNITPKVMADSLGISLDSLETLRLQEIDNASEFEKQYPILPTPMAVAQAYPWLFGEKELASNALKSIWLNLQGYFWAVLMSLLFGFIVGLLPIARGLFGKQVDLMRYLPLSAMVGLFIAWFGIGSEMKIAFLAFGIFVFMMPVVIERVSEVKDVYLRTVFTLGATDWQTIKSVYIPSVMSKFIGDIRVLTAISWTYIIIAEVLNSSEGGLGAMVWKMRRQSDLPGVFAVLFLVILIGFLQDRLFAYLDKRLFPHKYYNSKTNGIKEVSYGIWVILGMMVFAIILPLIIPSLKGSMGMVSFIVVLSGIVFVLFGEFKLFKNAKS